MENIIIKEACVTNYFQAKRAFELGANRLELCFDMANDGITPSFGTAKEIKVCLHKDEKGFLINFICQHSF